MSDELLELLGLDPDDPDVADALEDDADLANLMRCLHDLRTAKRLTQAEVATRMGTTQSAVSDLERTAADPRISTLQRYARAVEASLKCRVVPTTGEWGRATRLKAKAHVPAGATVKPRKLRAVFAADSESMGA